MSSVLCSRDRNANLFDAVRGGQGEFGIITEAWIRLRRAGNRYRQYEFRYRDFDRFAADFEGLVDEDRFGHLRAEVRVHDRQIILRAGAEYDDAIDNGRMVEGLGYDSMAIVYETTDVGHAGMFQQRAFPRTRLPPLEGLVPAVEDASHRAGSALAGPGLGAAVAAMLGRVFRESRRTPSKRRSSCIRRESA